MDVVGVDTLHGEVQRLAPELGLDSRVRFRGFTTQRELRPMLAAADLPVMASPHEAGPVVAMEAAVVGGPTVGTAVEHLDAWATAAASAGPVAAPDRKSVWKEKGV